VRRGDEVLRTGAVALGVRWWGGIGVQMLLMFTVSFFLIVHAQHELREYVDPSLVVTSNTIEGP